MHFPKRWCGPPQIVLGLVVAFGVFLLTLFVLNLKDKRKVEVLEDEEGRKYRRYRRHRRFRLDYAVSGTALVIVALVLLGLIGVAQEYLGLTGKILVAHVRA